MDFAAFALTQLPPPPVRVLEVGCGTDGGVTPALAAAGYDPLAIDRRAPEGPWYRKLTLQELDDPGLFDAAVCGRVLHHVRPLGPALDKLARLASLLILDEFSWNRIDQRAQSWYETRHRKLTAAGLAVPGPPDLDEWRARHPGLHTLETLKGELEGRFVQRLFQPRPYLYRWLGDPESQSLEQALIDSGEIHPIGWRYVGVRRPAGHILGL